MRLLERIMPFLVGGLAGVLLTLGVLALLPDRNSGTASQSEPAESTSAHAEAEDHHSAAQVETGPVVDLTEQSEIQIDIKDYAYARPNLRITKGATVTWTNRDTMQHNAMREHDDGDAAHAASAVGDVRADVFAGPLLAKGESYSFTFNEAGTYPYHCAPHPDMKAVVVVTD